MRRKKLGVISAVALVLFGLGLLLLLLVGRNLIAPLRLPVPKETHEVPLENVEFSSRSGATIRGWYLKGTSKGAALLLHGIRSNRSGMLNRAELLYKEGYSVLLIDFQAHGESSGEKITFGWKESKDAQSAVEFLKQKCPGEPIAVLGASLGGAAAVLANPPLAVEAMVLELVYPTIEDATGARLQMQLGRYGAFLTPLLTWQLPIHLGISPRQLRPSEAIRQITTPLLFLAGALDRHTPLEHSRKLFDAAHEPKELVIAQKSAHEDILELEPELYKSKVLPFLERFLRRSVTAERPRSRTLLK